MIENWTKRTMGMLLAGCMLMTTACSKGAADSETVGNADEETGITSVNQDETGVDNTDSAENDGTADAEPAVYGTAGEISAYDAVNSNYTLAIDASDEVHEISDLLYGIFIEDINFAADGGLYAEMVQNRSFEFTSLAKGNELHAWSDVGAIDAAVVTDDADGCLNVNNPNYVVLTNTSDERAGIANCGFLDGMSIEAGENYSFSVYARSCDALAETAAGGDDTSGQNSGTYTGAIHVALTVDGVETASADIESVTGDWTRYELTLTPDTTAYEDVLLEVTIDNGTVALDMVSLFPEDTYKGRENGLRKDLAEKLEELHPAFLRFPGGCVVEGINLEKAYNWKDSIGVDEDGQPLLFNGTYGDVAARKMGQDIWTNENTTSDVYPSFMTYGLGFYEYFRLAEDIGAIGVPVINAGLCCMGQSSGSGPAVGTEEFEQYIQDALDLVEFCRGGADTTWGAVRIAMGHEEPFELKYIGIGNEQWGDEFYAHYEAFVEAFAKAKEENPELYGDVELMFTAGVDDGDSGSDYSVAYEEAAEWLAENPDKTIEDFAGAIDHHYYNSPEWFLKHTDYYNEENYSRDTDGMLDSTYNGGINVFLGEYAAQSNTLEAALAEAAYMTGLERNGDIVKMAAYAPLFGNLTATHWAPDLIWFNNHTVTTSVNYYVQKIFSINKGSTLIASTLDGADIPEEALSGKVGVATWNTSAEFDNLVITDNETGEVLAEQDFSEDTLSDWTAVSDGRWSVSDGVLVQGNITSNTNTYGNTGSCLYYGDADWTNYTMTIDAVKTGGSEGFLIPFAVQDADNNYFWNIGGWGNTVSCLQEVSSGVKSGQVGGTVEDCVIKTGETYHLKIVVTDSNVKCYINDTLYVDYDITDSSNAESYQVVSEDENGDLIIKLVNVTGYEKTFAVNIDGLDTESLESTADRYQVAGQSLTDDNILGREEAVTLEQDTIDGITGSFNYTVPKYSVTVLRLKKSNQ
jgi:alpha-L-arabinofuranosidase